MPDFCDILFLDVDGVLNPLDDKYDALFAPRCVAELRRVLEECPWVQIVLTTTWRNGMAFFQLGGHWEAHGLPHDRVIGITPQLALDRRGEEIQEWLRRNRPSVAGKTIRKFAILDDEMDSIRGVFPAETLFACDPDQGFSAGIADRLIRFFK